jgi:prolipoprotein diacylglyceryltransferase
MRPILFTWRGVPIYSYPAMLYLGTLVGIVLANYVSKQSGMDSQRVWLALVLLVAPGLVGARLLFVASSWDEYRREPRRIWGRSEGGMAMLGGLPLAVLVSVPLLDSLDVPFAAFWDMAVFPIFSAATLGRVGCLLHGCCSGRPSAGRWAIRLPDHHGVWQPRVPVRILELMLTATILAGALSLWDRLPFPGALILATVAAYSFGRVALQPYRAQQDRLGRLNVHQVTAAAFGALALGGLVGGWLNTG